MYHALPIPNHHVLTTRFEAIGSPNFGLVERDEKDLSSCLREKFRAAL